MKFNVTQRADRVSSAYSSLSPNAGVIAHVVEADTFEAHSSVLTFYDKQKMPVAAFSDWLAVKAVPGD